MTWKPVIAAWLAWLGSFAILYAIDSAVGLYWHLGQLMWTVVGYPSPWGFWSLVFPRLLSFMLISMPPAWFGLLVYELRGRFKLWQVFLALTLLCLMAGLVSQNQDVDSIRGGKPAIALAVLILLSNVPLVWSLRRAIDFRSAQNTAN